MKNVIKMTIIFIITFSSTFLISEYASCYDEYTIFSESFEGSFPPEGWILLSENEENTWRKVDKIEFDYTDSGAQIRYAEEGKYFLFVGEKEGYYNERLISPIIEITEPSEDISSRYVGVELAFLLTSEISYYNANIAVCYDCEKIESVDWKVFADLKDSTNWGYSNNWNYAYVDIEYYLTRSFRISFYFEGETSDGFGIDNSRFIYWETIDDGPSWLPYKGEKVACCCALDNDDARPDVALGMLLMGAFIMILRRRKGN